MFDYVIEWEMGRIMYGLCTSVSKHRAQELALACPRNRLDDHWYREWRLVWPLTVTFHSRAYRLWDVRISSFLFPVFEILITFYFYQAIWHQIRLLGRHARWCYVKELFISIFHVEHLIIIISQKVLDSMLQWKEVACCIGFAERLYRPV